MSLSCWMRSLPTKSDLESFFLQMTDPQNRLAVYPAYVAWELKPKKPDGVRVQAVYARAIADAALVGDITTLETFWLSYITYLVSSTSTITLTRGS